MTWSDFLFQQLVDVGFTPLLARQHVEVIARLSDDDDHNRVYQHVLLRPGFEGMTLLSAINSDRIRTDDGIVIILDVPALRRAYDAKLKAA